MPVITPTSDELQALQTPVTFKKEAPAEKAGDIAPPTPAVLARVKELLAPAKPKVDVLDADKLAYVRHVLTSAPFKKSYTLYGSQNIVFTTINAELDRYLIELAAKISGSDRERVSNYMYLGLFESVSECSLKDVWKRVQRVDIRETNANNAELLRLNVSLFSADVLAGIYEVYRSFQQLLNTFAKEAGSPNFWKTL
jgi:hypothetical protein